MICLADFFRKKDSELTRDHLARDSPNKWDILLRIILTEKTEKVKFLYSSKAREFPYRISVCTRVTGQTVRTHGKTEVLIF